MSHADAMIVTEVGGVVARDSFAVRVVSYIPLPTQLLPLSLLFVPSGQVVLLKMVCVVTTPPGPKNMAPVRLALVKSD